MLSSVHNCMETFDLIHKSSSVHVSSESRSTMCGQVLRFTIILVQQQAGDPDFMIYELAGIPRISLNNGTLKMGCNMRCHDDYMNHTEQ